MAKFTAKTQKFDHHSKKKAGGVKVEPENSQVNALKAKLKFNFKKNEVQINGNKKMPDAGNGNVKSKDKKMMKNLVGKNLIEGELVERKKFDQKKSQSNGAKKGNSVNIVKKERRDQSTKKPQQQLVEKKEAHVQDIVLPEFKKPKLNKIGEEGGQIKKNKKALMKVEKSEEKSQNIENADGITFIENKAKKFQKKGSKPFKKNFNGSPSKIEQSAKNGKVADKSAPEFNEETFFEMMSDEKLNKMVVALTKKVKEECSNKNDQIFTDYKYLLTIMSFKIPHCPVRMARMHLKHSLVSDDDEVCLIVKDLERGRRVDCNPTKEHFEQKLREAGITKVKAIIPFNQIRVDYASYEKKIKLASLYDFYLCDASVIGHVTPVLGKHFHTSRRALHAVDMESKNLQTEFEKALHKTAYKQNNKGPLTSIPLAGHKMTTEQVVENIQCVLKQLKEDYPGGLENVRTMHLKINILGTSSIPIYTSICRPPTKVPVVIGPKEQRLNKMKQKSEKILENFKFNRAGEFTPVTGEGKKIEKKTTTDSANEVANKKMKRNRVEKEEEEEVKAGDNILSKKVKLVEKSAQSVKKEKKLSGAASEMKELFKCLDGSDESDDEEFEMDGEEVDGEDDDDDAEEEDDDDDDAEEEGDDDDAEEDEDEDDDEDEDEDE